MLGVGQVLENTSEVLGPGPISALLSVLPTLLDMSVRSVRRGMYAVSIAVYYTVYGKPVEPRAIHYMLPRDGAEWMFKNGVVSK